MTMLCFMRPQRLSNLLVRSEVKRDRQKMSHATRRLSELFQQVPEELGWAFDDSLADLASPPEWCSRWVADVRAATEDGADAFAAKFLHRQGSHCFVDNPMSWACHKGAVSLVKLFARSLDRNKPWGGGAATLAPLLCETQSSGPGGGWSLPDNKGRREIIDFIIEESRVWRHQPIYPAYPRLGGLCEQLCLEWSFIHPKGALNAWRHLSETPRFKATEKSLGALLILASRFSMDEQARSEALLLLSQAPAGARFNVWLGALAWAHLHEDERHGQLRSSSGNFRHWRRKVFFFAAQHPFLSALLVSTRRAPPYLPFNDRIAGGVRKLAISAAISSLKEQELLQNSIKTVQRQSPKISRRI